MIKSDPRWRRRDSQDRADFAGFLRPAPDPRRCLFIFGCGILPQSEAPTVITPDVVTEYIRRSMPDAVVTVTDRTGTMDHLKVVIVSDVFRGKTLLDRHRMIYQALDAPMKDGRIHALELTARTKDES
jgi:stress-induced morphogen